MGINKSKRYDRYFEGYEESAVIDENGKKKIEVRYTKEYYSPKLTPQERKKKTVLYIILFVLVVAFQVLGGSLNIPSNYTTYMTIAQGCSLAISIALLTYLCSNLTAKDNMEISKYKSSHRNFKGVCMLSAIIFFGTFICSIAGMIAYYSAFNITAFLAAFLYMAAAICCIIMWKIENGIYYSVVSASDMTETR